MGVPRPEHHRRALRRGQRAVLAGRPGDAARRTGTVSSPSARTWRTVGVGPPRSRALAHVPHAELAVAGGPPREELEERRHRPPAAAAGQGAARRRPRDLPGPDAAQVRCRGCCARKLALCLSPHQPSPSVPLEAMACGVPPWSRPGPAGTSRTVLDGITGLHVPAGRSGRDGRAIRSCWHEETTLHGYAIAAADRARSRYSRSGSPPRRSAPTSRCCPSPSPSLSPRPPPKTWRSARPTGPPPWRR